MTNTRSISDYLEGSVQGFPRDDTQLPWFESDNGGTRRYSSHSLMQQHYHQRHIKGSNIRQQYTSLWGKSCSWT